MDRKPPAPPKKSTAKQDRDRRLAESLRANLEKRKAQARSWRDGETAKK